MSHLLIQADARRIPLADKSIHAVITSPLYWNLRDYQTGSWAGGDSDCDHKRGVAFKPDLTSTLKCSANANQNHAQEPYRDICGKCGARRVDAQIGLEPTPEAFVAEIVKVFREVRRVLHDTGTVWINLGDSYANTGGHTSQGETSQRKGRSNIDAQLAMKGCIPPGLKPKDLCMIPHRVAIALQDDGWWVRSAITWCKTSPMPESVTDRPTSATEMLFLLTKSEHYFYDADAVRVPSSQATLSRDKYTRVTAGKDGPYSVQHDHETPSHPGGRNLWNYWVLPSESYAGAHFATFPKKLVEPCIRAGTSERGACPHCGKPWKRMTETQRAAYRDVLTPKIQTRIEMGLVSRKTGLSAPGWRKAQKASSSTLGWRPTCTCPAAEPVPCIVLDPFAGSGTTLVVAEALGRVGIGCDLSADYLAQARRRIERPHQPLTKQREQAMPLFAHMEDA